MIPSRFKLAGFILIVLVATVHLVNTGYRDWNSGADTAFGLGLRIRFFSKERIEDERVQVLKLKAPTVAFGGGWLTGRRHPGGNEPCTV